MTPKEFRKIMLILAVAGIVILLTISIYLIIVSTRQSKQTCPVLSCPIPTKTYDVIAPVQRAPNQAPNRDRKVLDDPLYPPLNRTDEQTFNSVVREVNQGNLYRNPSDSADSFRLVGYLSSTDPVRDAGGSNWKLMARMKDRQQGEYYIIPANNNIDLKIPLTPDIVVSERLRDVYTLPKEMRFRSPMLNDGVYQYTEIPKTDFTSPRYV